MNKDDLMKLCDRIAISQANAFRTIMRRAIDLVSEGHPEKAKRLMQECMPEFYEPFEVRR